MGGTTTRERMGRIAAVLFALVMAVGIGGLALAPAAHAEPVGQFTVSGSLTGSVSAYRVFEADVDGETNGASNVEWNSAYEGAVLAFLDKPVASTGGSTTYGKWLFDNGLVSVDLTGKSAAAMTAADKAAHDSAANALAFIAEEITASSGVTKKSGLLITADGSFSNNLAKAVKESGASATASEAMDGGSAIFTGLDEGFYLFSCEGSAPVWTPVGGTETGATLKDDSILALGKLVYDEATDAYGELTDAGMGDNVKFQVTGTLPATAQSTAYIYNLEDKLPAGLAYVDGSLKAYTADASGSQILDITSAFAIALDSSSNTLTAKCADLYNTATIAPEAKKVVFEYEVRLTTSATMGTSFNTNSATLTYGKEGDELQTTPDSADVATFELDILKVSSEDGKPLKGAKFTIEKDGRYLQLDGTLGDGEYQFESEADGTVKVPQLAPGSYTLTEVAAPAGFELPSVTATDVEIEDTINVEAGTLDDLTATATNGVVITADVNSGVVEVTIENDPSTVLPITGMTPDQTGTVIGILLVAAGAIVLVVRSRRSGKGERA